MNLRKMVLAASMGLAAVAVMAPMAQAEITDNTEWITETKVLHYEGTLKFEAGIGVFLECPITMQIHVSATGVPSVLGSAPQTAGCTGGGPFAGCIIESHSFSAGPVHVRTTTPDLTITNFTLRTIYTPGSCVGGIPSTHLIFPELTLSPHNIDPLDEHHSMDTLTMNGTAGNVQGTPGGAKYSGLLHITQNEVNTYTLST